MSELESLKKLREYASVYIETLKEKSLYDRIYDLAVFADEIEAEIERDYMCLPVDADGVPIHVGDSIEYPNGRRDIVRFVTINDNEPTFNESGWIASKCRHVKSRTLENEQELIDLAHNAWSMALCAMQGMPIPAEWGNAVERGLRKYGINVDEELTGFEVNDDER